MLGRVVLLLGVFANVSMGYAQESRIDAVVQGVKSEKGNVSCSIWNSEKGYPGDTKVAVQTVTARIQAQQAICTFTVPAGKYAIAAYHDENSNGKLDSNFIGIPTEGVAASNDAKGHMGPPSFEDAQFEHKDEIQNIKLTLKY